MAAYAESRVRTHIYYHFCPIIEWAKLVAFDESVKLELELPK